jgi:hypothetical protein
MRLPDARHLAAVILCLAAVAARTIVGPHITDDAFITMRYSRNLSASGAMSYNPPDAVLGTSTPLWTWVLAAGEIAGARPETTAVAAATLADVASILVILTSPAGSTLAALAAAATIAVWPAYIAYAVSGMETSLYVLTVVSFVAAVSRRKPTLAAAAAAMGVLCRPDGALLVALGVLWTFRSLSPRDALKFLAAVLLLCAPWVVYALWRFGSVVPSSVTAKAAAADPWFLSLQNVSAYFLHGPYLAITALSLAGFAVVHSAPVFWRVWALWAWGYLAGMTATNAFTHFPWYFVPLLPVYIGSAALAFETLARRFAAAVRLLDRAAVRTALAATAAAVLLTRMPPLKAYLDEGAAGREVLYASVASELAAIDARCTVAATEIGTIGYHYPGRVLDLVGLVSPEVLGRPVDTVLVESRARWLVTYDTHFDRRVAGSEPFGRLFERRSAVQVGTGRTLEVYERRNPAACSAP